MGGLGTTVWRGFGGGVDLVVPWVWWFGGIVWRQRVIFLLWGRWWVVVCGWFEGLWIPMVLGVVAVMGCDFESPFSSLNSLTFQPHSGGGILVGSR